MLAYSALRHDCRDPAAGGKQQSIARASLLHTVEDGLPQAHAGKEGVCMKHLAVHFSRRGSQFFMQQLMFGSGGPESST